MARTRHEEPLFLDWPLMTMEAIDALDRENTVVLVTSSPLEAHGPHLPVNTDIASSEGILLRVAELLRERHPRMQILKLPPVYVAADVLPHVGSLMFRQSTITRVFEDMGRSLCKQGFRKIWVAGFHGGPRHFVPIEVAAERVNRKHGGQMLSVFALLMSWLTGGRTDLPEILGGVEGITPDDLRGDSHAGAVETSIMLHLLGEHVDPIFRELPPETVDLWLQRTGRPPVVDVADRPSFPELMKAFLAKLKFYEAVTYAGQPALSSPELGERFIDVLAHHCADALDEVWSGQRAARDCHSPVWKARWIFTSRRLSDVVERSLRYRSKVW